MTVMALVHTINPCGHVFCYLCIDDWRKKSKVCPTCSNDIQTLVPLFLLDSTIRETLVIDPEALADLDRRVDKSRQQKEGASVSVVASSKATSSVKTININRFAPMFHTSNMSQRKRVVDSNNAKPLLPRKQVDSQQAPQSTSIFLDLCETDGWAQCTNSTEVLDLTDDN